MLEDGGVPLEGFEPHRRTSWPRRARPRCTSPKNGKLLGVMAVADTPKPTSAAAVAGFQALGIDVVMLTGDNQRTAEAVGRELGVTQVIAEVLPQDKEREVAALQEEGQTGGHGGRRHQRRPRPGPGGRGHRHRRGHRCGHRVAPTLY